MLGVQFVHLRPALQDLDPRNSKTDLLTAVRQALGPYAEAIYALQSQGVEIRNSLQDALEGWRRVATHLHDFFQQLASIDWSPALDELSAGFDKYQSNVLALAEAGWTLPDWIEVGQISELAAKSPQEIDDFMTKRFMAEDAQNLRKLHWGLLERTSLSRWHLLITEIVDSIREGRHRVAIPATVTIMEGFIANALLAISLTGANNTSPVKALTKAGWHKEDTYNAFFWNSGMLFLKKLFENSDFTDEQPTFVNRHWILHGRSSVDWTAADALRLINSLITIHFLFETVGCPGKSVLFNSLRDAYESRSAACRG